jgi:hypothetical protein
VLTESILVQSVRVALRNLAPREGWTSTSELSAVEEKEELQKRVIRLVCNGVSWTGHCMGKVLELS